MERLRLAFLIGPPVSEHLLPANFPEYSFIDRPTNEYSVMEEIRQ